MTQQSTLAGARRQAPVVEGTARVLVKPSTAKTGYVDGAWWPRSADLDEELPALLTASATAQLGVVHRVIYQPADWDSTPRELVLPQHSVRLDGYGHAAPNTIELVGPHDRRLVLLVVSHCTEAHRASTTMALACDTHNESTVEQLLTAAGRGGRTGRAAALRRWRATSPTATAFDASDTFDASDKGAIA